ncbi:hypothetical protein [Streptomyces cyaneofuscatus]
MRRGVRSGHRPSGSTRTRCSSCVEVTLVLASPGREPIRRTLLAPG